jgi:hypothetical protein
MSIDEEKTMPTKMRGKLDDVEKRLFDAFMDALQRCMDAETDEERRRTFDESMRARDAWDAVSKALAQQA